MRHREFHGLIARIWWVILAVVLVASLPGTAVQGQEDPGGDLGSLGDYEGPPDTDSLPASAEGGPVPGSKTFPQIWCGRIDDPVTKDVCWEAYRDSLRYFKTGLEHRTRVFAWQHFSTIVIFIAVLLLVCTGVFFAWIQFRRGDPSERHELEIGLKGIKVNSSVLGLIILALSLGFFYLYLVYVYPIQELI